jgi:hypothetical protein
LGVKEGWRDVGGGIGGRMEWSCGGSEGRDWGKWRVDGIEELRLMVDEVKVLFGEVTDV